MDFVIFMQHHFEVARILRPKSKSIGPAAEMMEEAKINADESKKKTAIIRTTMRWRIICSIIFTQWKELVGIEKQRISLLGHFRKAHEKSLADIFKA